MAQNPGNNPNINQNQQQLQDIIDNLIPFQDYQKASKLQYYYFTRFKDNSC